MRSLFTTFALPATILATFIATLSPGIAQSVEPADKAAMQSTMFQHIDRILVDGQYTDVNLANGEIRKLVPQKNHPMVLRMGESFVLCTDFRTQDGEAVNVDFYAARRGKSFVIFRTEIGNRAPLMQLMNSGKVAMAE